MNKEKKGRILFGLFLSCTLILVNILHCSHNRLNSMTLDQMLHVPSCHAEYTDYDELGDVGIFRLIYEQNLSEEEIQYLLRQKR